MTNKEKKAWLNRYRDSLYDIDCWQREMEEWRLRAEKITQVISDMPRGGESLGIDDIVAEMDDIRRMMAVKVKASKMVLLEIEIAIMKLDGLMADVLKYRYIDRLEWRQIAVIMGYSEQNCWKIHGEALEKIEI